MPGKAAKITITERQQEILRTVCNATTAASQVGELPMPKKRTPTTPPSQEVEPEPPKKPTVVGPDLALTLPTTLGRSLDLSYWDL